MSAQKRYKETYRSGGICFGGHYHGSVMVSMELVKRLRVSPSHGMSASCELYSFLVTHSSHVKGVEYARKWRFRITIRQWTSLSRVYTTATQRYVRAPT